MLVRQIVDTELAQYAYLIGCQRSGDALIVDPERDIDRYVALAAEEGLRIVAVAETHVHADFLSGARQFATEYPATRVYLPGQGGIEWEHRWPAADGISVTRLCDGESVWIGMVELRAWHTPGHTPEHLSFVVTDHAANDDGPIAVLSGDFVFVGDLGRPDLLETAAGMRGTIEPSARQLYRSARAFLALPDYVQVWPGHGAGSACGKAIGAIPMTTVGYERRTSPALAAVQQGRAAFVDFIVSGQPEPPYYFARMKRLNVLGPPLVRRTGTPAQLDAPDVREAHAAEWQFIDVRDDRRGFLRGHIAGAFLAPLDRTFPTVVGSLVDPDRPMVLIANHQAQVVQAMRRLVRIGYDDVRGWTSFETLRDRQIAMTLLVSTPSISFDELDIASLTGSSVLDVRSATEYAAGHIPGAINVAHTRMRAALPRLRGRGPWLVHCATGARAAVAVAFLEHHGVAATHVDGTFAGWERRTIDHVSHGPLASSQGDGLTS